MVTTRRLSFSPALVLVLAGFRTICSGEFQSVNSSAAVARDGGEEVAEPSSFIERKVLVHINHFVIFSCIYLWTAVAV